MSSPFYRPPETYTRCLNLQEEAIGDYILFMQRARNLTYEQARDFVIETVRPGGPLGMVDPDCLVLTQKTEGNREKEVIKFSQYISDIQEDKMVISPVLTNYLSKEVRPSILAEVAQENTDLRSTQKKKKNKASALGDTINKILWDKRQTNTKLDNNSLSGAEASLFNPLFNPSAHPGLTTLCRCESGAANANNERFIAGNFHYHDHDVALENIISIVRHSDIPAIEAVMQKYFLHYPTADDVFANVLRCIRNYTANKDKEAIIYSVIQALTPVERAAYLYTNNFYSLRLHNEGFVREFMTKLTSLAEEPVETMEEAEKLIKSMDNNTVAWMTAQCTEFLNGKAIWVALQEDHNELGYRQTAATVKLMLKYLQEYADLIIALWRTDNQPASVYAFPAAMREVDVLSDTDSTVFTNQEWVFWWQGSYHFNPQSIRIANTMVYLITQTTVHLLTHIATQVGVALEDVYKMEMKNEYMFLILALTSMGKNYYGLMTMQEGVPIIPPKLELKGPTLRDGSAPAMVVQRVEDMMRGIMDKVINNEQISISVVLDDIVALEKSILESIKNGDPEYLTRLKVKPTVPVTYASYVMWEEVFADKFGHTPEPEYYGVRVPLDTGNQTLLKEWVASWNDPAMEARWWDWMKRKNKKTIKNLVLPQPIIESLGVPDIFIQGMNIRRLISTLVRSYYKLLESYGIFIANDNYTLLAQDVVDQYRPNVQ